MIFICVGEWISVFSDAREKKFQIFVSVCSTLIFKSVQLLHFSSDIDFIYYPISPYVTTKYICGVLVTTGT